VGTASAQEADELNTLQATFLAMRRAFDALRLNTAVDVWVDGNQVPLLLRIYPGSTIQSLVKGDALMPAISAASVLAKVRRDRYMRELDARYPGYGFAQHKGYGSVRHVKSILELGITPEHRKTFEPIKSYLKLNQAT
jgi:ribonuclease HII